MNTFLAKALLGLTITSLSTLAVAKSGEKIRILNEKLQPIAGADVLIVTDPGHPFANNKMKTGQDGTFTITADWSSNQPLTITADGYIKTTFLNVEPASHEFQLHQIDTPNQIEIKGTTTGFGTFKKDGKVNFGLVYPALRRRQLATFDMDAILSPQFDQIKVFTETIALPSN